MEGIQISVERVEANKDISVVKINGYIDTTTSSELERVIQNLLREQRYKIIVDLAGTDYISSAGWGIFISEIKNLRNHRGDLKLANMSDNVNEVYELLEFSTILSAAPTLLEAVKMFEGGAVAAPPAVEPAPGVTAAQALKKSAAPKSAAPAAPAPAAPAKPAFVADKPEPTAKIIDYVERPLIERIRAVVKMHPDWGAWKIKRELNRLRGALPKVGWGEIRAELRFNGLKSKRDRFKFARQS